LYRAKAGGRNRAERAESLVPTMPETDRLPSGLGAHLVED
jgi:hypothetical protein